MLSLRAFYANFKNDYGDVLEVTDFSVPTWLVFGAALQLLSQSCLPTRLSSCLPLLYLLYRIAKVSIDCNCIFSRTFTNLKFGRWSATLPEPKDPSAVTATSDGVVMFLLGARINQSVNPCTQSRRVRDGQQFSNHITVLWASLRPVMPKSIECSKTCGPRRRRIERNGAVSRNVDR